MAGLAAAMKILPMLSGSGGGSKGAGALSMLPAAMQTGTGIYQMYKGNQLSKMERPDYSIPQEVLDNLTDAQVQALRGIPAEQRMQFLQNVARAEQTSLAAMDDRKAGLTGLAGLQQSTNDAYGNLMAQDSQARFNAEQNLQSVRGNVADYRDKEFELNQMNPFLDQMKAAAAMKGAGMQNLMKGSTAAAKMNQDRIQYNQLLNSLPQAQQMNNGGLTVQQSQLQNNVVDPSAMGGNAANYLQYLNQMGNQ